MKTHFLYMIIIITAFSSLQIHAMNTDEKQKLIVAEALNRTNNINPITTVNTYTQKTDFVESNYTKPAIKTMTDQQAKKKQNNTKKTEKSCYSKSFSRECCLWAMFGVFCCPCMICLMEGH